jgi:DNA-directed RNA polymerase specialized sigma24 family protein
VPTPEEICDGDPDFEPRTRASRRTGATALRTPPARELRAHIEAALQRCEAQREVFLLRERAGLGLARIAEGANVPP